MTYAVEFKDNIVVAVHSFDNNNVPKQFVKIKPQSAEFVLGLTKGEIDANHSL
jgi:hypothetical protein